MEIEFPFHIDGRGRTAAPADSDTHLRELIEQLLFTNPGERLNRPDFGSGLLQLVFAPNSTELARGCPLHAGTLRWARLTDARACCGGSWS